MVRRLVGLPLIVVDCDSAISLRRMVVPWAVAGALGGAVETRLSAWPTAFGGGVWGS
jgi:hypothetical protein